MNHECHAEGCEIGIPAKLFMCRAHWVMIPKQMQRWIWATYKTGQEDRKDPTWTYLFVSQSVVEYVAFLDGVDSLKMSDLFRSWADPKWVERVDNYQPKQATE